jgi:DNA polymerase-3 subunit epsilon
MPSVRDVRTMWNTGIRQVGDVAAVDPATPGRRWAAQDSLTQLGIDERDAGRDLQGITFCVVDLETTGSAAAAGDSITEVGAVKVRGGEVLSEFQTLVNPGAPIPGFIAVLTGITNSMVSSSPSIDSVLPAFLEFAQGCVLVAHNAPFDVGFLKEMARRQSRPWPDFEVLDTVRLARHVVTKDEAPNHKLSSLARVFHADTTPNHRALADARATVDVLHGLIARLGSLGVTTLEELKVFTSRVSPAQRRKRTMADGLPDAPGVYLFRDARERVLYVGTSGRLRSRVKTYFTSSETRSRMGEMVSLAERVQGIECATRLEAGVRELRLIAEHKPSYNRRSRFPEKMHFVKLTQEPWPRLALVRRVLDDGADYLGPFSSRRQAELSLAAMHECFRIRQCSGRMARSPSGTACALAELGRCASPCDRSVSIEDYASMVEEVRVAMRSDPTLVSAHLMARMAECAGTERFEDAATHRDRLTGFLRGAERTQRLTALARCPEIVGAQRVEVPGLPPRWDVHVVRHGRLAGAGVLPRQGNAWDYVDHIRAISESVTDGPGPVPRSSAEEAELILRWLESPGVRLLHVDGEWTCPTRGATATALLRAGPSAGVVDKI